MEKDIYHTNQRISEKNVPDIISTASGCNDRNGFIQ